MEAEKNRGTGKWAAYLPLVQGAIGLLMVAIAIWKPYVLSTWYNWLGPSERLFVRNPMLTWLLFAQSLTMTVWLVFAKPKRFVQWLLIGGALVAAVLAWLLSNDPPIFMG